MVQGGQPVGGAQRVRAKLGETLRIVVQSDVADEVHLHGYDRSVDVAAGGEAALELTADLPGAFEIELEQRHRRLAELVVQG